jgi:hypothetical protein
MTRAVRACCCLILAGLLCSSRTSLAYDPFYDNADAFTESLKSPRNLMLSIPGMGTFSLQDLLQQQGEDGDDMVYVAAAAPGSTPPAAVEAAAAIKGDHMLDQELPPATADMMVQLHRSLQQPAPEEQEQQAMHAAYPSGTAAVSSLTNSWIGSTL